MTPIPNSITEPAVYVTHALSAQNMVTPSDHMSDFLVDLCRPAPGLMPEEGLLCDRNVA